MVHARAAQESQRRFRALVDANVVGVTVSDEDRVLEANDAWLAITGHDRAALDAGELSWRAITPPEWLERDDRVMQRLRCEGWVEPYEKEYLRLDGSRVPVLVSGVTLDAEPLRVVALVIDLSERHEAEAERERLLGREREARREAELAHDRMARLQRVTSALSAAISADEVAAVVVEQAVAAFGAAAGALAFPDGDEIAIGPDRGFEAGSIEDWRRFPLGLRTPIGDVLRHGVPVTLEDPAGWERYAAVPRGAYDAMAVVPLVFAGRVLGALVLCDREPRHLTPADHGFLAALADQAAQALERGRLYEERAYVARTLQDGLLPERLATVPGLDVAVRYHSIADGGAVGGDFYDCFDVPGDRWVVAVGDVAGKGTAAAVLTGLARHTLRAIGLRGERPQDMLRFLNQALRRQWAESAFCTVAVATLERTASGGFAADLASGGHPYPLLVRAGSELEEVVVRGTLLGVEADPKLEPVQLSLAPGDTLVLYTDGVTDAADARGERFGEARLHAAVEAAAGGGAEAVADAVDQAIAAFEQVRRRDDRAIVVLRVA